MRFNGQEIPLAQVVNPFFYEIVAPLLLFCLLTITATLIVMILFERLSCGTLSFLLQVLELLYF